MDLAVLAHEVQTSLEKRKNKKNLIKIKRAFEQDAEGGLGHGRALEML